MSDGVLAGVAGEEAAAPGQSVGRRAVAGAAGAHLGSRELLIPAPKPTSVTASTTSAVE